MYRRSSGGRYLEITLFTLSALLLYHTGIGIAFFLIPLQVVASRRGFKDLLVSLGIFLAVFTGIRCAPYVLPSAGAPPDALVVLEAGIVGLLLLGLCIVNCPLRRRPRTLIMLAASTVCAGIVGFPGIIVLSGTASFQQAMNGMYAEIARMLSGIFAPSADGIGGAMIGSLLEPAKLRQMSEGYLLRSLLADYIVMLAFSWWAGQAAAARSPVYRDGQPGFHFARFRLESWWLWPFIAGGGVILVDLFFHITPWAYAAWNVGIVMLFLYGLQGMSIICFLFEKYHIPRFVWVVTVIMVALCALSPGAGVFVILAVPVFGISENWIRYRIPRDEAPKEKS
jgi:hypothetical protein